MRWWLLEVMLFLRLVTAGLLMRSFVALREGKLGLQPGPYFCGRLPLPVERLRGDQVGRITGHCYND